MVRHNNMIPNNHFHKHWQLQIKTWFNQPEKKKRRKLNRDRRQKRLAPKPVNLLRPIISCPTVRYHTKKRIGRGFTLRELKSVNIHPNYAKTIGMAVDYRRRNKSIENLQQNVQYLKQYLAKLIVFPRKKVELPNTPLVLKGLNKVLQADSKMRAKVPSPEEKQFSAYSILRKARADKRYLGKRMKRKYKRTQDVDTGILPRKIRISDDD